MTTGEGNRSGPFEPLFQAWPDCAFAEMCFHVDPAALQYLNTVYPLPETLQGAVLKRQIEFLAGRACAQHAIARLTGQAQTVIPAHEDRSPVWPAAVVGAITHTAGYAAALVAPHPAYAGIGIDCEQWLRPEQLPLQRYICASHELEALLALDRTWTPAEWLTLIFSAKESLYKCLYPRVRKYFGFHAARVVAVHTAQQTFTIQLEDEIHAIWPSGAQWSGTFGRHGYLLMTAIVASQEAAGAAERP